ncbi:MAG: TetR/AcrR family transcriptional regulator [Anaerolineae bacterium]|nr:TetR/AcrR family transcriptional regulator [Anaerolineae bacterium]MDW8098013.1 TetR/AcrR family transcriptional regulator [Anaerolineae bacterium]
MASLTSELVEGKELILREAERLFSQRGYQGVSIRELAQACGMTNAALYYHFKDKEDLFCQMAMRQVERLAQTLRERAAAVGKTPQAQLVALAHAYAEHLRQRQDTAHVYAEAFHKLGPQRARALHEHFHRHMLGAIAEVIRAGQETGALRAVDPHMAARAFLGMMGMLRFQLLNGEVTPQQVEQLVDIFLHGVVATSQGWKP